MPDDPIARFIQRRLSDDQRAMLALLGRPEIIGGAGTGAYYIEDPADANMPFLQPPYTVGYYTPVVMVLDRLRQVMPNGDLQEVEPGQIGPPEPDWPI